MGILDIAKTAVGLGATAFGGPAAGGIAAGIFGAITEGKGKGGAEGAKNMAGLIGPGGPLPGLSAGGIQPNIASEALSLFKSATTPEQKMKLLDVAIYALGGQPGAAPGGMSSLSTPGNSMPPSVDGPKAEKAAKAERAAKTDKTDSSSTGETSGTNSTSADGSSLKVDGNKIDTGRYEITASNDKGGQVKILDKETNTFVEAFGDPHVVTSDGDKAQFHKNGLSITLPDGTSVHMKPTETDKNGMAYIDSAMVEKDGKAVTMNNIHGKDGVKTSQPQDSSTEMQADFTTQGQTVLDASNQDVGDLFMTGANGERTKELVSPDKELNLDGMGGAMHKDGDASATSGKPKGSELTVNPQLLQKLGQILQLTGANVPDRAAQQPLLQNIQQVLSTFIKPAEA